MTSFWERVKQAKREGAKWAKRLPLSGQSKYGRMRSVCPFLKRPVGTLNTSTYWEGLNKTLGGVVPQIHAGRQEAAHNGR